ncbi:MULTISPECIES: S-layer homology domain-containing protein [Pontibacillus]|uniref:S-layer homology domain-containing protein n=1 Tax=Pontibacillus chungwhensis TaxID=265426 RepID=A0ABY8UX18_9BACI|nr:MULTISPECIES: S-layer homology domain-containing protein [Pontibacillus]MCD5324105.1 S-layer homology domain-containing protein [Pontibacillus sp. HN14]WIF97838.1 S-layer homology domain-containing protein [Pontibacillus chungwhensis]
MAFQPKSYRKFMVASASAALVGSAVAPAVASAAAADDFTDVDQDTRHYEEINALYEEGVFTGYGDGTFGPEESLKRSEAAEMIFAARGLEAADKFTATFEDVPPRIENEIQALYDAEIFDGYSEVEFGSDMKLNRAEMAKIVIEAFELKPESEDKYEDAPFTDLEETKLYPYINAVYELDIADGFPDGEFKPHDEIKRGDFAKMLYNAWMIWKDNQGPDYSMLSEVGNIASPLPGVFAVEIPLDNLDGATAETVVTLDVDGETVELEYDAERDAFRNIQVSGFEKEELEGAWVVYEKEEPGEVKELGSVTELNGKVAAPLPGVMAVEVSLDELDGETADSTIALWIDGEEVELSYDDGRDSFRNIQISGYSEAQLKEATVVSKP